jgi:hypothetical protein
MTGSRYTTVGKEELSLQLVSVKLVFNAVKVGMARSYSLE